MKLETQDLSVQRLLYEEKLRVREQHLTIDALKDKIVSQDAVIAANVKIVQTMKKSPHR